MTFSEKQVEWIVVEVIRRLGLLDGADNQPRVAMVERNSTTVELRLTDRVVTLNSIEGQLTNVSKLVVSKQAVVTPAVKDELKTKRIALVRA